MYVRGFDTLAMVTTIAVAVLHANRAFAEQVWPSSIDRASQNRFVLVAAHRGGYADDKLDQAPENSIANVALAIKKGYDVYETDIQRTSDGVFVIVHDPTLDRETNGTGAVRDTTWADLKKLRKRYRDGSLSDQPIASVRELLLAGRGKILFKPDLKPGVIEHFGALAQLIAELQMTEQVFLRTDFKHLGAIKKHFANGCPHVEMMLKTKNESQVAQVIESLHPKTIQVDIAKGVAITPVKMAAIQCALKAGVLVETHCYSDRNQWQQLAEAGVRMFHTGIPDATLEFLGEQGWRQQLP